jgi:hypothetical protein
MTNRVQAWLREPLLHFLVLGLLIFGAYALVSGRVEDEAGQRIEVGPAQIQWLSRKCSIARR